MNKQNKLKRILKKLSDKVEGIKKRIKMKNNEKIVQYKREKDEEDLADLAKVPIECKDYASLKEFTGEAIEDVDAKDPVFASKKVILSEPELAILKKGHKFILRNAQSK